MELLNAKLNWDKVYDISLQNRIFPIIYHSIKRNLSEKTPENFTEKLKTAYSKNAARNLYLSVFLIKTIEWLNEKDIFVLPFKGPAMAQNIYGNLELRCFSDLDILVPQKQAVKAWKLFEDNNFLPELSLRNRQKYKYTQTEDHMAFSKKNVCIELHWEMSGRYTSQPLGTDQLSDGLEYLPLLNQKVPNLMPEYLLIYLCIHGAKHGWENLDQVSCISVLLEKEMDWLIIKKLALRWRCKKILSLGVYLACEMYDKTAPDFILENMDKKLSCIAQATLFRLIEKPNGHNHQKKINRFSFFHFKIRDRFSDQLRYFLRLIFSPTDKEWFNYPMPAYLSWCHFILRPMRLAMEKFGK